MLPTASSGDMSYHSPSSHHSVQNDPNTNHESDATDTATDHLAHHNGTNGISVGDKSHERGTVSDNGTDSGNNPSSSTTTSPQDDSHIQENGK